MNHTKACTALLLTCLIARTAFATVDTPNTDLTPNLTLFNLNKLNYSGYIDGSYNYLIRSNHFTSGNTNRYNDLEENGFTLQQAAFTVSYQPKQGFGGLFNAMAGRDAAAIAPYGWDPYFGSQVLELTIPQAYLQFASGIYTVMGGVFDSEMGVESYDPLQDTNFSRSIVNGYAEPGVTMGVRGLATTDRYRINASINNGWSGIRDTGRQPTFELGAKYIVSPLVSVILQGMSGEQRLITKTSFGPTGRRNMFEVIADLKATNQLTLMAGIDYAFQTKALLADGTIGRAVWQGLIGYANYQLTEKWLTSLRGEVYTDSQGYTTGVNQNWREVTLTLGYKPGKSWLIRAETRHDISNKNSIVNRGGPGTSNNQQSYAMEAAYIFL